MDKDENRPGVISYEPRVITLTDEQVAQMSDAKKALLKAAASGSPIIIRH